MKFNPGAFFDKLRGGASGGNSLNIALYIGLAIFLVLALINFLLSATTANEAQENITRASEMRVISQQLAKNALEAAAGNADAFELLDKSRKGFQEAWGAVKDKEVSDPQVQQRGLQISLDGTPGIRSPLNFSRSPLALNLRAPLLGEHQNTHGWGKPATAPKI